MLMQLHATAIPSCKLWALVALEASAHCRQAKGTQSMHRCALQAAAPVSYAFYAFHETDTSHLQQDLSNTDAWQNS